MTNIMRGVVLAGICLISPITFAATPVTPHDAGTTMDPSQFQYRRDIPEPKAGANTLWLDIHALGHSQGDLGDLRILNGDHQQVPYVLEKQKDPLHLKLPLPAASVTPGDKKVTSYRLDLPVDSLPASTLLITTPARVFSRHVILTYDSTTPDARDPHHRTIIDTQVWTNTRTQTAAPTLRLNIPPLHHFGHLYLQIDEGDNAALPLSSIALETPTYHLHFFYTPVTTLILYYGQHALRAPGYDLALLPQHLTKDTHTAQLGAVIDNTTPNTTNTSVMVLFWIILVLAVGILLVIMVRLLRKPAN